MTTRPRLFLFAAIIAVLALPARDATAQYRGRYSASDLATGETYNIEVAAAWWNPAPDITVSSESLGLVGTQISAGQDLGLVKRAFPQLRVVLRPAKKHKFRFSYTPINYTTESTLKRDVVFNGILYHANLPVNSSLQWKTLRLGYEYDFIYRDRGFLGAILEAKYTNVQVSLASPLESTAISAHAPIPAVGGIARVYVVPNISITGEVTGFKLPDSIDKNYRAHYVDFDFYGTLNFSDHYGVQGGYRSLDVGYVVKKDSGSVKEKGPYVSGVVRF